MKTMSLTKAKSDLSAVIRDAENEEILITRLGRPAAIVIGFANESLSVRHEWQRSRSGADDPDECADDDQSGVGVVSAEVTG